MPFSCRYYRQKTQGMSEKKHNTIKRVNLTHQIKIKCTPKATNNLKCQIAAVRLSKRSLKVVFFFNPNIVQM